MQLSLDTSQPKTEGSDAIHIVTSYMRVWFNKQALSRVKILL